MTIQESKEFVKSIYPEAQSYHLENDTYFIAIGHSKFLCWNPTSSPCDAWVSAAAEINKIMIAKLEEGAC